MGRSDLRRRLPVGEDTLSTASHRWIFAGESVSSVFWRNVGRVEDSPAGVVGECWMWCGPLNGWGYGRFYVDGTRRLAHRVSWEIQEGEVPIGLSVLHHCDRPACVRPSHLYVGTQADNIDDMVRRGRQRSHSHLLPVVLEARRLAAEGMFQRDIAARLGVGQSAVSRMLNAERWGGQCGFTPCADTGRRARGDAHHLSVLSSLSVVEIRRRAAVGERLKDIAVAFGVHTSSVKKIVSRETWKHLP